MIKILFVCLGNICRSPMAEAIFKKMLKERRLTHVVSVQSAGIMGWHVGKTPDKRTIEVLNEHGIETNHVGQKLTVEMLDEFQHIAVMDESDFETVYNFYYENKHQTPAARKVFLVRDFDPQVRGVQEVPDPYYENKKAFRDVYDILSRSCTALIDYLVDEHKLQPAPEEASGE